MVFAHNGQFFISAHSYTFTYARPKEDIASQSLVWGSGQFGETLAPLWAWGIESLAWLGPC